MEKKINILIFRDKGWWIAQCLEYDIVAQARTMNDVQCEFQRVFFGRISVARELGVDPFEGIPAAPESFQKIIKDVKRLRRVEFKPIENIPDYIPPAFMLPNEAMLYAY